MSKAIKAIMSKLRCELNQCLQQLHELNQQLDHIAQQCQPLQVKYAKACMPPNVIIPELELSRQAYLHKLQQEQAEIIELQQKIVHEQSALSTQRLSINTKLKILEKHHDRLIKNQHKQAVLHEQKQIDEWVLLHG